MKKYLAIAGITYSNIIQYRWEILVNQIRTVIVFLSLYYLWTNIFLGKTSLFGFSQREIITYLFLSTVLRQFILFSAADQIAGELQSWGKFFSYLLKPVGYFRYWFTVDLVYKIFDFVSVAIIVSIFLVLFKVSLLIPHDYLYIIIFAASVLIAMLIYFFIAVFIATTGFWTNQVWGLQFLTVLLLDFSAGAYFPLDVLPPQFQTIIRFTPFPYLLYFPLKIFLQKVTIQEAITSVLISTIWLFLIFVILQVFWRKGLKVYEAWGG